MKDEKIKESPKETINHTLKMHQEKTDIKEKDFTKGTINQFLKTQYISTEGSENWRFRQKEDKNLFSIKNSLNNSKSPEKKVIFIIIKIKIFI